MEVDGVIDSYDALSIWRQLGGKMNDAEWNLMFKDGPVVLHVLYADFVMYSRWRNGRQVLPLENFTAAINALIDDTEDDPLHPPADERKKFHTELQNIAMDRDQIVRRLRDTEKQRDELRRESREKDPRRKAVSESVRKAFLALQSAKLSLRIMSEEDREILHSEVDKASDILETLLLALSTSPAKTEDTAK